MLHLFHLSRSRSAASPPRSPAPGPSLPPPSRPPPPAPTSIVPTSDLQRFAPPLARSGASGPEARACTARRLVTQGARGSTGQAGPVKATLARQWTRTCEAKQPNTHLFDQQSSQLHFTECTAATPGRWCRTSVSSPPSLPLTAYRTLQQRARASFAIRLKLLLCKQQATSVISACTLHSMPVSLMPTLHGRLRSRLPVSMASRIKWRGKPVCLYPWPHELNGVASLSA